MILTDFVNVKIINHNIKHYINLGYSVQYKDIIKIPVKHLTKGSHIIIKVKCEKCNYERSIRYDHYNQRKNIDYLCPICTKKQLKKTIKEKYGVDNISQVNSVKEKKKQTNLKNWGVENVFQSEKIKKRSIETLLKKYGVSHVYKSEYFIEKSKLTRIKNKNQIPDEDLTKFDLYKKKVMSETRKCKDDLFNNWNGYDFYDNSYIKDNIDFNKEYPTMDHKISIFEGYTKNIDPKIIGNIDNLCITTRSRNSSKFTSNDKDFKNKIKKELKII